MQLVPELRPLNMGEMLDAAIYLYRRNFAPLSIMAATLFVPFSLLEILVLALALPNGSSPEQGRSLVNSAVNILYNLASYWFIGSITFFLIQVYLGRSGDVGKSLRFGSNKFGSIFGANFLQVLAIVLPSMGVVCAITLNGILGVAVLVILLIPWVIFLITRWTVFIPAIIHENIGGTDSLRRSWNLTRDHFWRVAGISLLSFVLLFVIAWMPSLLAGYGLRMLGFAPTTVEIIQNILTRLGSIITFPVSLALDVVVYFDLLVRKEGFDLALQVEAMNTLDEQ